MKKILIVLIGILSLIVLTACQNTMQGFGKDMEHAGKELQKSS
jgi:predicted small secreted protein